MYISITQSASQIDQAPTYFDFFSRLTVERSVSDSPSNHEPASHEFQTASSTKSNIQTQNEAVSPQKPLGALHKEPTATSSVPRYQYKPQINSSPRALTVILSATKRLQLMSAHRAHSHCGTRISIGLTQALPAFLWPQHCCRSLFASYRQLTVPSWVVPCRLGDNHFAKHALDMSLRPRHKFSAICTYGTKADKDQFSLQEWSNLST